jgi:hypothetical protein
MIFGSTALKHWYPDFPREPKDLDIISKNGKSTREIEIHWNSAFEYIFKYNNNDKYVDPDFLYTIKMSHAAWDVRWDKTMFDIKFLKEKGCQLDPVLFNLLMKDWEIIHGTKKIIVKGKPEEFFNQNVTRKFNHEELHQKVKFLHKPMHEFIREDLNDVKPNKELWDILSDEGKIYCALEEAYVFAIERYLQYPANIALTKALKHLITKSTKGYFNLFLIDNFFTLMYNMSDKFLETFKECKNE